MCLFLEQAALSVFVCTNSAFYFKCFNSHNVKERVNILTVYHMKKYDITKIVYVFFFGKISSNFQELGTNMNNFSHFFVILLYVLFILNFFDTTCNIRRYIN